jgi:hypothetical protein
VLEITLTRVSGYRRSQRGRGEATHHLFARSRTLRIRQIDGFGFSTVASISPRPATINYGSVRTARMIQTLQILGYRVELAGNPA